MSKKKKSINSWLMQFLIGVMGTAIGVGLTFAISHRIENKKKEQAQRLTAMMVIHDIDESVNCLRTMKEYMETGYNAMIFATEQLDKLDSVLADTLYKAIEFIMSDGQDFRFDMSKEKIFHSSPDTWQNLGSMKFIDNVQSFYFERQAFQDLRNSSSFWREPLSVSEFEKLKIYNSDLSVEEYMEQYNALLRDFLKEQLEDSHIKYYIEYSPWRLTTLVELIEKWSMMNDENKFLMSITDEELETYVNSISKSGIALTEKSLIGTWEVSSSEENSLEWNYRKDHTYSVITTISSAVNLPFAKGKIKIHVNEDGNWTLKGDSIVQLTNIDALDVDVDASNMVALPGKQEMCDSWVQEYSEELVKYYQDNAKRNMRNAYHARLDTSHDKMELKGTNTVLYGEERQITLYLKRK